MANRNGMGPDNLGAMTGRGLGNCTMNTNNTMFGQGRGQGVGAGNGLGRKMGRRPASRGGFPRAGANNVRFAANQQVETETSLEEYKQQLENELQQVTAQLEDK